jgi:polar amino acid transport system substrate-binding protein
MASRISRRNLIRASAAGALGLGWSAPSVRAQTADLLGQLRTAGLVRVGLANQPPYSGLNPDGTVSGFVPVLVQRIMATLGIPRIEGVVATYGELVPGLQAGRWHMIAASFRLTRERCQQVLFTDPVTFDGGAFAHLADQPETAKRSLAELAAARLRIGLLQGSYLIRLAEERGIDRANISQFPNNPALLDGLMTRRVQVVVSTQASLKELHRQRGGRFEIVYPIPDDPPVGSAPAFRPQDRAFHEGFQRELRALRGSGELDRLAAQFGFDPAPPDLMNISETEACSRVS